MKDNNDYKSESDIPEEKEEDKDSKKKQKDWEKIHIKALEDFKVSEEYSSNNRDNAIDDIRFGKMGYQWPDRVRKEREDQGRPCLVINKMPAFVRTVVNDARQNKPQIKVQPVDDDADVETAKIFNGLIKNIETVSRADIAYDTAMDYAVSSGVGYIKVVIDYTTDDTFDKDVMIERVANPLTVYEDPHSESADGSDWNTCFVTKRITKQEFEDSYPDAQQSDFQSDTRDGKDVDWFGEDSVRIAEYWCRKKVSKLIFLLTNDMVIAEDEWEENQEIFAGEGVEIKDQREAESYKVTQYIISGAEVLEEHEWPGKYIPVIPVYGNEYMFDGKRIIESLIRPAKDSQQNFNYWRSATTELVALAPKAPFIGPTGAFKTDQNWQTANTLNHDYLEYDGNIPPQRQPFAGPPAGALQESLSASDDMKDIMGIHDASLGLKMNETSGKAIHERRTQGDVSTFHFKDNMNRAIRQVGAILIDLIPHVYSEKRIIRVIGEDGTPQNYPINQPVRVDEKGKPIDMQAMHQQAPQPQMAQAQPGQMPAQPAIPMPQPLPGIERVYDLTIGKYDLVVSAGPAYNTRREEAAEQMGELLTSFPQAAPYIGDLLVKNLDWPGAEEISERLKEINPILQAKKGPPPPSPEVIKAQAEIQARQLEIDRDAKAKAADMQIKQQSGQIDLALKQLDLKMKEADMQIQREKNQIELVKARASLEAAHINHKANINIDESIKHDK